MSRQTVVPTPPRLTDDKDINVIMLHKWVHDFYSATVVQSGLLDPDYQGDAGTFDPDNLPDPEDSSIAKAQDTANRAYELAAASDALKTLLSFSFTLSGTSNQSTATFGEALSTADYVAIVVPTSYTGSPASGAFIVVGVTKSEESVIVTFSTAPGVGATVTYDVIILPNT